MDAIEKEYLATGAILDTAKKGKRYSNFLR